MHPKTRYRQKLLYQPKLFVKTNDYWGDYQWILIWENIFQIFIREADFNFSIFHFFRVVFYWLNFDEERFHQYSLVGNKKSSILFESSGVHESCSTLLCFGVALKVKCPFAMVPSSLLIGWEAFNRGCQLRLYYWCRYMTFLGGVPSRWSRWVV